MARSTVQARDQITETLLAARRLLSKSQSDLHRLNEHSLVELHESLEGLVDQLGGLIPGATPPGRIEDFFTQVGEGMLASQAELDRQSFAYNAARPPGALPSAYRIPRVQAEIGFTMSRKRQRGFGIFALSNQQAREKAHNNSVTFEIVAAPPVPDAMEALPLGFDFVARPADRDHVSKLLQSAKSENATSRQAAATLHANFDQVLIIVQKDRWLLLQPQVPAKAGDPVGLLHGVLEAMPLRFTSHGGWPATYAKQSRMAQIIGFLSHMASEQALALATLREPSIEIAD